MLEPPVLAAIGGVECVSRLVARAASSEPGRLRLWPTAEPGVVEGEWTASGRGGVDVGVTIGSATADAIVTVADQVERAIQEDSEGLAFAALGSGGDVRPARDVSALVSSLAARVPARPARVSTHPMRSPWWLVPFAGALMAEWAWRRRRGWR